MIICDPAACCGCMACADKCPHGAITPKKDKYGFVYPEIDASVCTQCGACQRTCPNNREFSSEAKKAYAAYNKNTEERLKSSSGGMFVLLAKAVLDEGGAVFGAGYDESFLPTHVLCESKETLSSLMGSKYAQSNTSGIWKKVKEQLEADLPVLFSGTPCQCAALHSYLGREYPKLLTVDFICHGVPSQKLLQDYYSNTFTNIKSVAFRNKDKGWHCFSMKVEDDNGVYSQTTAKDPYFRLFVRNAALRESCYNCSYKDDSYSSDITLGDFWGIGRVSPEMNDDKGISAVIIRSEKGQKAFDALSDRIVFSECQAETIATVNPMLVRSTKKPPERERLMSCLAEGVSFDRIKEEFAIPASFGERVKNEVKHRLLTVYGAIVRLKKKLK